MNPENMQNRDRHEHLTGLAIWGQSGYIEKMEATGQQQLVESAVLPADDLYGAGSSGGWSALEAMGIVRGEPVEGDPLFVYATLPEGWTKRAMDHSMWSEIVDERGITRATVFYKAAFYDRRAHIRAVTDVGGALADALYYGDDEPADRPPLWRRLTTEERAQFDARLLELEQRLVEDPDPRGETRLSALRTLTQHS